MDRTTLALAGDQDELIAAVAAANPRTIVVLNTGGPVLMPWLGDVEAVLQAWYPGERFGAAVADVLFGDTDPGGRLPVTFPASDDRVPRRRPIRAAIPASASSSTTTRACSWLPLVRPAGRRPLFPFGHGLSYARFRVATCARVLPATGTATVSARVATGAPRRHHRGAGLPRLARGRASRPSS